MLARLLVLAPLVAVALEVVSFKDPTCAEVRRAYQAQGCCRSDQGCCKNESQPFDVTALGLPSSGVTEPTCGDVRRALPRKCCATKCCERSLDPTFDKTFDVFEMDSLHVERIRKHLSALTLDEAVHTFGGMCTTAGSIAKYAVMIAPVQGEGVKGLRVAAVMCIPTRLSARSIWNYQRWFNVHTGARSYPGGPLDFVGQAAGAWRSNGDVFSVNVTNDLPSTKLKAWLMRHPDLNVTEHAHVYAQCSFTLSMITAIDLETNRGAQGVINLKNGKHVKDLYKERNGGVPFHVEDDDILSIQDFNYDLIGPVWKSLRGTELPDYYSRSFDSFQELKDATNATEPGWLWNPPT